MKNILVVAGNGEELIKLGPVIRILRDQYSSGLSVHWIQASDTPEHLWEIAALFRLAPDREIDLSAYAAGSVERAWALSNGIAREIDYFAPHLMIVQGSSQTALLAAQQAFIRNIPVLDIQDELGTGPNQDYTRLTNRKMLCALSSFHCVPNPSVASRLRGDGFPLYEIGITGDPVVDAMRWIQQGGGVARPLRVGLRAVVANGSDKDYPVVPPAARVLVAIQSSTRWSSVMTALALAIANLSHDRNDVHFVIALDAALAPTHELYSILSSIPGVSLRTNTSPTDLLAEVLAADLVVTDSTLVIDEAESIARPVIALHESASFVVGRSYPSLDDVQEWIGTTIDKAVNTMVSNGNGYSRESVLGDGLASQRIGRLVSNWSRNQSLTARSFEPFRPETHGRRVQWVGLPTLSEQSVPH